MKRQLIKLSIFFIASICKCAYAAGFVSLPATGFQVDDGISAYTLCHTASHFGESKAIKTRLGINDRCAIFPTDEIAPLPGFEPVATNSHPIVMNNTFTQGTDRKVGHVTELVWRNAENSQCIYGTKVVTTLGRASDYDATLPGKQFFKVNDVSRGGFSGLPVEIAYSANSAVTKPLYRVGRTFTAVQYRGTHMGSAPGYRSQPLTIPTFNKAINGVDSGMLLAPLPAQQSASLDDNWITFTTYVTASDGSKKTSAASGMLYIKSTCSNTAPEVVLDAIRLRQTEAPFIEVSVPGFVPAGGKVTPLLESLF